MIDEGDVYDAQEVGGPLQTCCFTSLCRLSSGTILAAFRLGSTKDSADANCLVAESTDGGSTWRIISHGFDRLLDGVEGEIREADLMELDEGVLAAFITWVNRSAGKKLYEADSDSILPTKMLIARSRDGGQSWQPSAIMNTGDLTGPVMTGPTVRMPDKGCLAFFENFQHETSDGPSVHGAHAQFSRDGQVFDRVIKVARHPQDTLFYWDQRHAQCPKTGRLVGMFWTYDRQAEKDVPIHMAWGDPDALTWEPPFSTGIEGQVTFPIPLPDGRLLAFYVHRHAPGSMRLIGSADGGKTWDRDGEVIVYRSGGKKQSGSDGTSDFGKYWDDMSKWSFGHPTGVLLNDHTILLAYYAGPHERCLSVRWARVHV